jgi:FlaA1/EpsC-like NDP-sugar epimerase
MIKSIFKRYANKFISKWLVLAGDLVISLFCFTLAYLIRYEFSLNQVSVDFFKYNLLLVIAIRIICFVYYQSYTGIIRHTSFDDAYILFKAIITGAILLSVISFAAKIGKLYIPYSIILIDAFISLFALITVRLLVKLVYEEMTSGFSPSKPVVIYGSGDVGLSLKNSLQNSKKDRFDVLYFIDDNLTKIGKSVAGIKVISRSDFFYKIESTEINPENTDIVLAFQSISASKKASLANEFLEHGIVLKSIPKISDLMNQEINVKTIKQVNIEDLLERDPISLNNDNIKFAIENKTVMVTGAAGSIGSEIARQLLAYQPKKLILIDQAESALYDLETDIVRMSKGISQLPEIHFEVADITNYYIMHSLFAKFKPSYVFHAAAYKHVPLMEKNPYNAIKTNVFGTKLLSDLSSEFNVKRFVMVSTDKAVNPTNVMGATKRLAEMYVQSLGSKVGNTTDFITTRFGNVLDSNGSVVPLFKRQIAMGGPITVTHKDITRYFMTIPEACQLVLEAGTVGNGQEVYVFDMGTPVRIYDLAVKMVRLAGLELGKDIEIQVTDLRPGEKLYEELLANEENTIKTYHPKIMIAKVKAEKHDRMQSELENLSGLLESGDETLVSKLKELVPEYVSNNSVFEKLDVKELVKD